MSVDQCWYCGGQEDVGSRDYFLHHPGLRSGTETISVPLCSACEAAQKLALILFFVVFAVVSIGGLVFAVMSLIAADF